MKYLVTLLLTFAFAWNSTAKDGFFQTEKKGDIWWLRDPNGKPFLSLGVCCVSFSGDNIRGTKTRPYRDNVQRLYASPEAWEKSTAERLATWGFNTLGLWSKFSATPTMPHVARLDVGAEFVSQQGQGQAWLQGKFPDVFDPGFIAFSRQIAETKCTPLRDDKWLIGWFLDNELKWTPDWRGPNEMLTDFLNAPAASPGRDAAFDLLEARHPNIGDFNVAWKTNFATWADARAAKSIVPPYQNKAEALQNQNTGRAGSATFVADCDAFLGLAAEKYFSITTEAIRAVDPNHPILGSRFPVVVPLPVRRAAGKYCDVISINSYASDPRGDIGEYDDMGKPVIIGEFNFRGADAGLPNSNGGLPVVATQAERARATASYLRAAFAKPSLVGAHWFQWADQPKEGRFDGEDSNVGLVNIEDQPYDALTTAITEVARELPKIHAAGK